MVCLVCIFAILAILISVVFIDMGTADRDKKTTGQGLFILAAVFIVGGLFYAGVNIPLVAVSLVIGLPMCYNSCKRTAFSYVESPSSNADKIIGSVCWVISMLLLIVAFYYWYYIPEYSLLTISMSIVATVAFGYTIYCLFTGRNHFLSEMTAIIFAAIVFYYGEIRGIIPLNRFLRYWMISILTMCGIPCLIGIVHRINIFHEPEIV